MQLYLLIQRSRHGTDVYPCITYEQAIDTAKNIILADDIEVSESELEEAAQIGVLKLDEIYMDGHQDNMLKLQIKYVPGVLTLPQGVLDDFLPHSHYQDVQTSSAKLFQECVDIALLVPPDSVMWGFADDFAVVVVANDFILRDNHAIDPTGYEWPLEDGDEVWQPSEELRLLAEESDRLGYNYLVVEYVGDLDELETLLSLEEAL